MSSIGGRQVDEQGTTMGGWVLGEEHRTSTVMGTMPRDLPPAPKQDEHPPPHEYRRAQPSVPVEYADLHPEVARMTLSEAHALLEELGGQVTPNGDDTLAFTLPAQLSPTNLEDRALRRKAHDAIRTLDAARTVTHYCLKNRKPLPNVPAAIGGGVAA